MIVGEILRTKVTRIRGGKEIVSWTLEVEISLASKPYDLELRWERGFDFELGTEFVVLRRRKVETECRPYGPLRERFLAALGD
jgi:hypothetical protein